MFKARQFAMTLETIKELESEIRSARVDPRPALPALSELIREYGDLPRDALFLGLAEDGLPVLLNLSDAAPGPLFLSGEAGCGKTAFLHTIIHAAERTHGKEDIQYCILHERANEWDAFQRSPLFSAAYLAGDPAAATFLQSLTAWAHSNKGQGQFILLIIDGLESVLGLGEEAQQNLRWLLLRGPSRRVWPIVTLNSARASRFVPWMEFFRTRFFGHIQNEDEAFFLTNDRDAKLFSLMKGVEFAMREGNGWLRFWLPGLE